jgi:hypothetical protein
MLAARFWVGTNLLVSLPLSVLSLAVAISVRASAGERELRNVILITLDGLRGEEVFSGADQRLMTADNGVQEPQALKAKYWRPSPAKRRELLMPFLWKQCQSSHGWIAGDTDRDSIVRVTNGHYFSYPGYNELLCGRVDPNVDSNDKTYNRNVTVLEWLHGMPGYAGKVAAYCSWDVFPYILNDRRSGIPVNAGWQPLERGRAERIQLLNTVAEQLFHQWAGVRFDVFTALGAIEEIRTYQPRVLFVALGETDDWAHEGHYDRYLTAAHQNDEFIRMLWDTTQEYPTYRNNTLFLITSDHGRGDGRREWRGHGESYPGSERCWIAAFGNHLEASGIDRGGNYELTQIAATVAAYLGHDFTAAREGVGPPLPIVTPVVEPSSTE